MNLGDLANVTEAELMRRRNVGVTSVEIHTNGALGGKVVFPDERNPEAFQHIRQETFLLRGRTLADFINKTKTEKWKALVEILGLDAIESLRGKTEFREWHNVL